MPDKIGSPHICISLHDVCQEELIVGVIVTTQQTEVFPSFYCVKEYLVTMSPLLYASIIFNIRLARKILSTRHMKSKYLHVQKNNDHHVLLSTRDVGRFILFVLITSIVCEAANVKYSGLLSAAIVDALGAQ
jgi:hypothetical protein